jgi:hypothetical protein
LCESLTQLSKIHKLFSIVSHFCHKSLFLLSMT